MIQLNQKEFAILEILNENHNRVSTNDLCLKLGISPRTLRYRISGINAIAKEKIILSDKNGYYIKDKELLYEVFQSATPHQSFAPEKNILIKLLEAKEILISELAESVYVSDSTLSSMIKRLNAMCERYNLSLKREGNLYSLTGSESAKRNIIVKYFFDDIVEDSAEIFQHDPNFQKAKRIIKEYLSEYYPNIDTVYYKNILVFSIVQIHRIASNNPIEGTGIINDSEVIDDEGLRKLREMVQDELDIIIDEKELLHIQRSLFGLLKNEAVRPVIDKDFKLKIKKLLEGALKHYEISCDFTAVLEDLCVHVYYLIIRAQAINFFKVDKTLSLKYSHPYLYEIAVYLTSLIEKEFCISVCEDEIDLLTIYIGVITRNVSQWKAKTIVICPNYRETKKLIETELKKYFPNTLELVAIVDSYSNIPRNMQYDLVISAVKEEKIIANVVYINPLLSPHDVISLQNRIRNLVNDQQIAEMRTEILQFFDADLFLTGSSFSTGKEVLEGMFNKLVDRGIVSNDYSKDVLQRESIASTAYQAGVAFPHALSTSGQETKIVYYSSKTPIDWFGQQVSTVILLVAKQYDFYFLHLYNLLIDIFANYSFINQTKNCKSIEELSKLFYKK